MGNLKTNAMTFVCELLSASMIVIGSLYTGKPTRLWYDHKHTFNIYGVDTLEFDIFVDLFCEPIVPYVKKPLPTTPHVARSD